MAQPIWTTPAGDQGIFSSNVPTTLAFVATPVEPAKTISYKLLNGSLPAGLSLNSLTGIVSGTTAGVTSNVKSTFTLRAIDDLGGFRDRTFSATVQTAGFPRFTKQAGLILTVQDSVYTDYQIKYSTPIEDPALQVILTAGSLPPGLYMNNKGRITGYASPPLSSLGNPITRTYYFSLTLISTLGNTFANYEIKVRNYALSNPGIKPRIPVILNYYPEILPVPKTDSYYDYYIVNNPTPIIQSGSKFAYKIIGKDFDYDNLTYYYSDLPLGLVGDPVTGWITGVPTIGSKGFSTYKFTAYVTKNSNGLKSEVFTFSFTVFNQVKQDISWITDSNLGIITNNELSTLSVQASSAQELTYRLIDGKLPANLSLNTSGELIGRVAYQPKDTLTALGDTISYTFTIEAIALNYPLVNSQKTFTVNVYQYFDAPTENIYFKATPSLNDRTIVNSLLTDASLIPDDYIYRPTDINFGKATDVTFVHAYGMNASTIEQYVAAIQKNHYNRNVTLGPLKTAVARDDLGNIIYEVVYSEIKDDLVNSNGVSIPQEIRWPFRVSLQLGPWLTTEPDIYTSFVDDMQGNPAYYTSLDPGYVDRFYPASFANMRSEVAAHLGENYDGKLLPRWMYSQQLNGDVLGYTQAWVICYTKPRTSTMVYSDAIVSNIQSNWPYKLNVINFGIDRYYVDKSSTYNYNSYLTNPAWNKLPSADPVPDPIDTKNFTVLFPRKTILP